MTAFATVDYEKHDDGVAVLTLARPEALNAFNVQMRDDVHAVLEAVRDDPDVRGLLVRGAGDRAFCAGADLTEFGSAPSQVIARQVRWERDVWGLWLSIDKPMVAAIHGYCLGSGVEIASVCDLRVAADDAVFGMPEVGLGLIPAAGGTQLLPRLLGPGRALDLLLTGRRFTARDALRYGFITRAVPTNELEATALALLRQTLLAPTATLAAAKRAVREGLHLPLAQGLALERRLAAQLSG
jgi:enoyl-CoA hydratase/carnithine racemase